MLNRKFIKEKFETLQANLECCVSCDKYHKCQCRRQNKWNTKGSEGFFSGRVSTKLHGWMSALSEWANKKNELIFIVLSCRMTGIWTQFPVQLHRFSKAVRVYHMFLCVSTATRVTAAGNHNKVNRLIFSPCFQPYFPTRLISLLELEDVLRYGSPGDFFSTLLSHLPSRRLFLPTDQHVSDHVT